MFTTHFASHRYLFVVAGIVAVAGCDVSKVEPPEIAKPLGYETVQVQLPGCPIPLPPVRDDGSCGASEIGKSIDVKDVCRMLVALKDWVASAPKDAPSVHPDDWARIRAVCIVRAAWASSPHEPDRWPYRPFLRLQADVPDRSQRMVVQTTKLSRNFEYYVSPR